MRAIGSSVVLFLTSSILFAASPNANYGKLPLTFEKNQGQFQGDVDFVSRGTRHIFRINPSQFELQFPDKGAVRTTLMHSNGIAVAEPLGTAGRVNYLVGANPANWRTDIPAYEQVRYRQVYRGIDLTYYGNGQDLEYTFFVSPHESPRQIEMQLDGVQKTTLLKNGDLELQLAHGNITWKRPIAFQMKEGKKTAVISRFELRGNLLRFSLGNYDHDRELVIDPTIIYSTYVGTADSPGVIPVMAADAAGNAYITGSTSSPDWPVTPGAFDSTLGGSPFDLFVTKLNSSGIGLIYSTYIGGDGSDEVLGITVDKNGNAYLAGTTTSSDFPHTAGAYTGTATSNFHGFILKLNATGSALAYSASLPSVNVNGIAVDASGNAFVTGAVRAGVQDLPMTTPGAYRSTHGDLTSCGDFSSDVRTAGYVWELNASGSTPLMITYLDDCEFGAAIALDKSGNIYIAGKTEDRLVATAGAFQPTFAGFEDCFITVLNPSGTAVNYSTFYGGQYNDTIFGMALDGDGNPSITGYTSSFDLPVHNAFQDALGSSATAFVAKFSANLSQLIFGTYLGGDSAGFAVAEDRKGRTFVTGDASDYNFPTYRAFQGTCGLPNFALQCVLTPFVAGFDADGTVLYSSWMGSRQRTGGTGFGIASDAEGNVTIAGLTDAGFPTTSGTYRPQPPLSGFHNFVFATRISSSVTPGCTLNRIHSSVTICSPLDGSTVKSPFYVNALLNTDQLNNAMQIYVDGVLTLEDFAPLMMDTYLQLAPGAHRVSVKAWRGNQSYLSAANITVSGTAPQPACALAATIPALTICSPLAGSVVQGSNVHVVADSRSSSGPISAFKIYVDGVDKFTSRSASLDTNISLSPGVHRLSVKAWSVSGETMMERVYITAQ